MRSAPLALQAAIYGLVSTFLLHIPIIGAIWGLISALPLTELVPFLGKTGTDVEVGALWMTLKSGRAWLIYLCYYSFIWFLVLTFIRRRRKISQQENNG